MSLLLLYLLLTKATLISFSGTTSLPVIRQDFVEHYHQLTDRQLNAAMAAGQAAPDPTVYTLSALDTSCGASPAAVLAGWR